MSELTIIMPFVGAWEYTKEALRTIRTKYVFTLLLIDNKPELNIVDNFNVEYPEIFKNLDNAMDCDVYYDRKSPGLGVAASWNHGIHVARQNKDCKYILIANNDILFHPKTIDHLILFIDRTNYGMVTATNKNDGKFNKEDLNSLTPFDFDEFDLKPITDWREEGPDFSCFMIKPDLVDKTGWFDENFSPAYYEDNDYHYRMFLSGIHAKRISTAPYYHYGSKTSELNADIKATLDKESFIKNKRYFLNKWGALPSDCMDGHGYKTPFNNPNLNIKDWKGHEKYENV